VVGVLSSNFKSVEARQN